MKNFKKEKTCGIGRCHGCGGAVYGLGFIGALVYYLSTATGFWIGVFGILKAIVWPAFLIYNLFKFLGM
ncbi:hypothetical protein HYW76_03895 [Candidatus Pacearchaeota archaeon]|nr:hypothetical protein [Candidatus Pacearchaeota archaeon]